MNYKVVLIILNSRKLHQPSFRGEPAPAGIPVEQALRRLSYANLIIKKMNVNYPLIIDGMRLKEDVFREFCYSIS